MRVFCRFPPFLSPFFVARFSLHAPKSKSYLPITSFSRSVCVIAVCNPTHLPLCSLHKNQSLFSTLSKTRQNATFNTFLTFAMLFCSLASKSPFRRPLARLAAFSLFSTASRPFLSHAHDACRNVSCRKAALFPPRAQSASKHREASRIRRHSLSSAVGSRRAPTVRAPLYTAERKKARPQAFLCLRSRRV
jgi:hypothetical protein